MALKRISFQSIPVDDQDRALAFYRDVLGFEVHTDAPMEKDWRWIFLIIPGAETRLQFAKRQDITVHDKPALALTTEDIDADCARWAKAGVTITNQPQDAPWLPGVRWATIRDSEDNILFIESLKEG
jgi:predicted enzyme related to lactoylglutathione lyase